MHPDNVVVSAQGVPMPGILYGTAWKKERTAELVEQAIGLGFRGIDTACQPKHYHEEGVGKALVAVEQKGIKRQELYLQSKFTPLSGQDPLRLPYNPAARLSEQVAQSFQRSLENLHTTYLDGLILHSPLAQREEMREVWTAMEVIYDNRGARQLGISNCYDLQQLESLVQSAKVKPALIQNRFYQQTRYDRSIRAYCQRQGIIYQSFWTLTANPKVLAHATLHHLTKTYRRTAAQIFFRYLSLRGIIPLTGTTSAAHMREDLAIFDFSLSADECTAIDALL
ncbi:MAG: aldo/keto reductase [Magnetococcales bacterium]|nr:aldo/keto reductase [Magnetococcales bacterium]MBF0419802.1 aldo/keto reductase [Magnetococcales bacterium]